MRRLDTDEIIAWLLNKEGVLSQQDQKEILTNYNKDPHKASAFVKNQISIWTQQARSMTGCDTFVHNRDLFVQSFIKALRERLEAPAPAH